MPKRSYEGDPLDLTWQDIKDRPYKGPGETIYATDPEPKGSEKTDNIPPLPKQIDREDVAAIIEWLVAVRDASEDASLDSLHFHRDHTEAEDRAYRTGRYLVAEGALDTIHDELGFSWDELKGRFAEVNADSVEEQREVQTP